ncbi:site-specific integrase [Actinomadura napierensis]
MSHDLRNMHATMPLLAGVPVHVAAARLDPSLTLRVYARVIKQQPEGAASIFAKQV